MLRMAIDEPKTLRYLAPTSVGQAVEMSSSNEGSAYLAGGCDLLDQIKHQWHNPRAIVNLKTVSGLRAIDQNGGNLTIWSLTKLADIERSSSLRTTMPGLVMAASRVATPQIRNMGTVGGNLLQDSRCPYYRGAWLCYRAGGLTCDAHHGINDEHAIFGGDRCYTVTPSDLAPMMVALEAHIVIEGPNGVRSIPAADLFVPPSENIHIMHRLQDHEILTRVEIPVRNKQQSVFVKNTVRNAWNFSRASVAVSLILDNGICQEPRIVLGGVAPTPWRHAAAERKIAGQRLTTAVVEAAAETATEGASALDYNGYKIPLVRKLVRDALTQIRT